MRLWSIVSDWYGHAILREAVVVAIPAHGRFAVLLVNGKYRECVMIRNGRIVK